MKYKDTILYIRLTEMLRDAKLSALYYENRLRWANFWYFAFEIFIAAGAAGAAGTGIAALTVWQQGIGVPVWYTVSVIAAGLAFLKPMVAPGTRLQTYSRQHQGWYALYFTAEKLLLAVRQSDQFSDEDHKTFNSLFDRQAALNLADVKMINTRLVRKLKRRVDEEIPADSLTSLPLEQRDRPPPTPLPMERRAE
jgi:hypothetical protein